MPGKPRYPRAPPQCLLTTMPVELLHCVFELLDLEEVFAARATCSLLAAIGIDYLLDEVQLVYKRDKFERLRDIAKHPELSTSVLFLYFQGDRFVTNESFEEWKRYIRNPKCLTGYTPMSEESDEAFADRSTPRGARAYHRAYKRFVQKTQGGYTRRQLTTAHQCYLTAAEDQQLVGREGLDSACLEDLFRGCPRLDSVNIAIGHGPMGRSDMPQIAFANNLKSPYGDSSMADQGVRQLRALSLALRASGRQLRDLTLTDISPRALYPDCIGQDYMAPVITSLHRFRLQMQTFFIEDEGPEAAAMLDETSTCVGARHLHSIISAASGLRELKLHFPTGEDLDPVVSLAPIFVDTTWSRLRKLQLCHVLARDTDIVDVLFRHKNTLRELDLFYIELLIGFWEDVFKQIGGKLPRLRRIRLRGRLVNEDSETEFYSHPAKFSPHRDAIETFILKGGAWPDLESFSEEEQYPWDVPGYVEPTLEHDDEGSESDGSAESYESDEFKRI